MACKILVVDDNAFVRRMIREAIERKHEWTVCEAENGKVAFEMVASQNLQLVVLDLSMPVMNGLDAAKEILKIAPAMPTIMFTTHEHGGLQELAHRVGIKRVFSKTDGMSKVCDAMEELLATGPVS